MEFVIYSWCALSLGTPFLTTIYVQQLGNMVGLTSLGESGNVLKNNEILAVDDKLVHSFIKDMEIIGIFPVFTLLGPLAIPVSLIFGLWATIDFLVYVLRQ